MARQRQGHTAVWRGKRVKVHLIKGEAFVAKFKDKTRRGQVMEFFDHEPVPTANIRTISIYKGDAK